MVTEWGMHPAFGPVRAAPSSGADPVGEQTRRAVDEAVKALVAEAYTRAVALLTEHREALDRIAGALLAQETLDGPDLERLLWPDLERDAAPVAADVAPDEGGSGRAWPVTGD
jgi:cell division protease FtsH